MEEDKPEMIAVLTTRNPCIVLYKTQKDVIDKIYDYCLKHKTIGHYFDW